MEIYKKIKLYEDYEVSNLWNIRSISREVKTAWWTRVIKTRILKQNIPNSGYAYVTLYKNNVPKKIRVQRLVAQAFLWLEINDKKSIILHKDNNKLNNKVDNLKIWTHQENTDQCIMDWRFITHKKRRACWKYKKQTEDIIKMRKEWYTNRLISEITWLSPSYTSMIYNKKRRVYIN